MLSEPRLGHGPSHLPIGTFPAIGDTPASYVAMRERVAELEGLCAEVYEAAVLLDLPPGLLAKLWVVASHGNSPQGFSCPLPDGAPLPDIPLIHHPGQSAIPTPELVPLRERKMVMVVEDDPAMLDLILKILSIENYEVVSADCGDAALDLVHNENLQPDLLITDLMMPGCTGAQLATAMRRPVANLRVLYQTGFTDQLFKAKQELESGAAFLEKPFSARGLMEAARLALFGTINPAVRSPAIPPRSRGLWHFLD
jgi:CheY-like chemotaxis protein